MNRGFTRFTLGVFLAAQLSGCAPSSAEIKPSYVSPLQYQGYTCRQIRSEMMVVARHANEVEGEQDHHSTNDAVATGVGVVIFWPALFFLASKDQREEVSRLKGEYDALEEAAIRKNCDVAKEVEAAKKMQEKRKEDDQKNVKKSQSGLND